MNLVLLPNEHLNIISKSYPNAWKLLENLRQDRGIGLPKWPSWCFLPMAGWYAIACEGNKTSVLNLHQAADVSRLAALGAWRYSQGIYRFDENFYNALSSTVPSGDLPCEVLYRLPEWSVYIETPNKEWQGSPLHGFWCHLEWDVNTERHELRLLLNTDTLIGIPLHLGKWTLTEAVDRALQEAQLQSKQVNFNVSFNNIAGDFSSSLYSLISLVLYLCSDEPEIDNEREPGIHPKRPQAKRIKKGWRLFPANKPKIWNVGQQLGEKLRQLDQNTSLESTQRSVRPHLRRAHWHGFWKGPYDGERRFHYHWLPPMVVAGTKDA